MENKTKFIIAKIKKFIKIRYILKDLKCFKVDKN